METLTQLLEEAVRRFPGEEALQGDVAGRGRVVLTRAELKSRSGCLARGLMEAGVRPGECVALLAPNQPEWAVGFFGILHAGAVVVPLDVNLKEGELQNIVERARPAALVTDAAEADRGEKLLAGDGRLIRFDDLKSAVDEVPRALPGETRGGADLALVSFSSGTTGYPKGVMLTHGNIASNVQAVLGSFPCGPGDVFLSILPLHHMFEITGGLLTPLLSGARVHYLASLNPRVLTEAMQSEGVTICLMVPALARLIHRRIVAAVALEGGTKKALFQLLFFISKAALGMGVRLGGALFPQIRRRLGPRLRYFVSGGAALNPAVARDLLALGIEVIQGYGLTETAPVTHANPPGKGNRIGTVGPPVPGVEVRIEPVEGAGEGEGEVQVRGPNVMPGYFDNPELTAEVFRDGWFCTGDIGRVDAEGYLTICGRSKNVIVAESGKNIYPEEVEDELAKSDLFKDVCVVGKKTLGGGEEVFAVVVLDPEADLPHNEADKKNAAEMELRRLGAALADYKRVSGFVLWPGEEIPQTTTRKHKREEVKAVLRAMSGFGAEDF